jgi:hypothetical protein
MAGDVGVIWGGEKEEYFLMVDLTGKSLICPDGHGWVRRSRLLTGSGSLRFDKAVGMDLLRVMISKSANFTFNVTVRPRLPVVSQ